MATMAASAVKQVNLESSILFMQQEHAATLKGLHEEIQKLQKRCSGVYTFPFCFLIQKYIPNQIRQIYI